MQKTNPPRSFLSARHIQFHPPRLPRLRVFLSILLVLAPVLSGCIGSARTGAVTAFIEDMESTTPDHSGAEGVGVDRQGNVYGAVVRRQMLERHVRK